MMGEIGIWVIGAHYPFTVIVRNSTEEGKKSTFWHSCAKAQDTNKNYPSSQKISTGAMVKEEKSLKGKTLALMGRFSEAIV